MTYVRAIADCCDLPTIEVGGKAVGLGQLTKHGKNVPEGFVVTTQAYRRVISETSLGAQILEILRSGDAVAESRQLSAAIRELFEGLRLPDDLSNEIVQAYEQIGGRAPVAVRSSATAEDLAEASFAGQQETFLWISGAGAVVEHVVRCWASLFTQQAIAYRSRLDSPAADLAMAVVVQRMVPAEAAGVMMTLEPVGGDPSVVYIEAAFGLGKGVVRGDVEVDRFWVDKATGEIRRREVATKQHAYIFDVDADEVRLQAVEAARQDTPTLSDAEVTALAALGVQIEEDFGRAMDIEWAIDPDRELFTLQARAETIWSQRERPTWNVPLPSDVDWDELGEDWDTLHSRGAPDLHWSTDNIGEGLPGVLTPLGYTFWKENVDHAARKSAWAVGAFSRREVARPPDDRMLVRTFYGRAAMQTEFYSTLGDRMPGTTGQHSVEGVLGRVPDDLTFSPTARRYPLIAWRLPKTLLTTSRAARALAEETDRWWRDSIARVPTLDLKQALDLVANEAQEWGRRVWVMQGVIVFGVVSPLYQAVVSLIDKTGVGDIATLSGAGGAEMAIIEDIWRASRGEMSVEDVVANHGFHGPAEGEISSRVWREDSEPLRRLIQEYANRDDGQDPVAHVATAQAHLPELHCEMLATLPAPQRPLVRKILQMASRGIPMRGITKRGMVQCIDVGRAAARRAGELLADDGVLAAPDDIFHLTVDELRAPLPADVRNLVAKRKARRELYRMVDVPAMWKGNPAPVILDDSADDAIHQMTGIGVSAGVVDGRVRVVHDPTFAEVGQDEILVAPTTDPSWSAIMFVSKGLVVDIGGALSHAAVVARELGVPCVVNTRVGTKALCTGDLVRVDGGKGTVDVLERAATEDVGVTPASRPAT